MDNNKQSSGGGFLHPAQFAPGIITPRMLAATTAIALGDLYYTNANGTFARLPIINNAALTAVAGIPTWQAGYTGTITIPKLTTANGSITVKNGIITAVVQPT